MISDFLHRLVGEFAKELVARLLQPLKQHVLPGGVEQMPRDRLSEIAVGLLDQQAIAKIKHVAVKGELVAVAGLAEQQSRLPDEIKRQVRKADVDLEHRPVPAPLADPLPQY